MGKLFAAGLLLISWHASAAEWMLITGDQRAALFYDAASISASDNKKTVMVEYIYSQETMKNGIKALVINEVFYCGEEKAQNLSVVAYDINLETLSRQNGAAQAQSIVHGSYGEIYYRAFCNSDSKFKAIPVDSPDTASEKLFDLLKRRSSRKLQ